MVWVLIPAKDLTLAKSRLAPALSDEDRRILAAKMLCHVLSTVAEVTAVTGLWVITDSPEIRAMARRHGARVLIDPSPRSGPLRAVIDHGLATLLHAGASRLAVFMADLPLLTRQDVSALLTPLAAYDAVLAPDGEALGTNALCLSSRVPIATCFGHHDSFRRHGRWLSAAGARWTTVQRPGLAFDLDTTDDKRHYDSLRLRARSTSCR